MTPPAEDIVERLRSLRNWLLQWLEDDPNDNIGALNEAIDRLRASIFTPGKWTRVPDDEDDHGWKATLDAPAQPSADAAGDWVMVPRVPTEVMLDDVIMADVPWEYVDGRTGRVIEGPFALELSGPNSIARAKEVAAALYRAFLAAAPSSSWRDEQVERDEWKPIESAPRDGTMVDLWIGQFPRQMLVATEPRRAPDCWFAGGEWRTHDDFGESGDGWTSVHGATHWRPLPAPPRAALSALQEG